MLRITLVQPVQSPYWTARLRALAEHSDLDLTLLLERSYLTQRPGWELEPLEGVRLDVVGSTVVSARRQGHDLGYEMQGIRSIPWRLPYSLWMAQPDVAVFCNATQLLLALPVKLFKRLRFALIVEDTPHATRNASWLQRLAKRWIYRRADRWFAYSEDAIAFLGSLGITEGVKRSAWSLDMAEFRPKEHKPEVGSQSPPSRKSKRVLFVGQFVPSKGVMLLLEAWRQLSPSAEVDAHLTMIGSGGLMTAARDFVRKNHIENVEILGQLPYAKVRQSMRESDLFVLPTLQDVFSLAVLEAMACGCATITTPFAGARELVVEGRNGWVIDPTEPGALADLLALALSDRTNLEQMGRNARADVEGMDNVKVMSRFADDLRALARE